MSIFSSNLSEEFAEVYERFDWSRFLLDLLTCNSGDGLSPQQERCLRGIALDLPREQIAAQLDIKVTTIKDYLKKPYRLIEMLFPDEITEERMNVTKVRSLILKNYKKSLPSVSDFAQNLETNNKANENEALEDIDVNNEYVWQTFDEVQPYIEKFHELCQVENYTEAFYTIFDTDDYGNCVHKFLRTHGYLNLIITLYSKLIESWAPRKNEKWEFLTSLSCLGDACNVMDDHEAAVDCYEHCLNIALEIEDLDSIGGSLVNLGFTHYWLKAYEEALARSREGLEIAREIGLKELEATVLNNIGLIYRALGEHYLAIDYHYFSLEVGQSTDDLAGNAGNLINIGNIYRELQKYEQAILCLQKGIEVAHQCCHKQFEANGWFNLALALNCLNQYSDALSAYKNACILYQQMEMLNHVEECEMAISIIYLLIEDVTLAQAIEEDALEK